MPLKVESFEDELIDKICKESTDDLNKFYEIDWVHHLPVVIVVKDRKSIDLLEGEKTEPWIVGLTERNKIFILDHNNLSTDSDHIYSPEKYHSLLKHEISHAFYSILSGNNMKPVWLCEGTAIYTSGQNSENSEKHSKKHFKEFLSFYENGGKGVYAESGFAVELLVKGFGKQKLLDLIKGLRSIASQKDFTALFIQIYGMEPTYEKFNELLEKYPLK
jgi:hypothetical protein